MTVVTSIVRDRGRALGVVVAVTVSAALLTAPMAFGAGDPVASGTFKLKLSGGFKKQLKQNHVKLKPAKFGLKGGSQIDPTTGAGTLFLGKVTFKKGGKKYAIKNAKATLGASGGKGKLAGKAKGGVTVKLFKLSGGTLAKLNLGLALLPDPDLLLLDEPYAGFDWDTYQKFWGLVADRRTAGRTVLVISHFLVDEDRFDRIVDLKDGRALPR